jgi:hypothetical protein
MYRDLPWNCGPLRVLLARQREVVEVFLTTIPPK